MKRKNFCEEIYQVEQLSNEVFHPVCTHQFAKISLRKRLFSENVCSEKVQSNVVATCMFLIISIKNLGIKSELLTNGQHLHSSIEEMRSFDLFGSNKSNLNYATSENSKQCFVEFSSVQPNLTGKRLNWEKLYPTRVK